MVTFTATVAASGANTKGRANNPYRYRAVHGRCSFESRPSTAFYHLNFTFFYLRAHGANISARYFLYQALVYTCGQEKAATLSKTNHDWHHRHFWQILGEAFSKASAK